MWGRCGVGKRGGGGDGGGGETGECLGVGTPGGEGGRAVWCLVTAVGDWDWGGGGKVQGGLGGGLGWCKGSGIVQGVWDGERGLGRQEGVWTGGRGCGQAGGGVDRQEGVWDRPVDAGLLLVLLRRLLPADAPALSAV